MGGQRSDIIPIKVITASGVKMPDINNFASL